jgi:hypothetical protein
MDRKLSALVLSLFLAGSASAVELYGIDDTSLYTVDPNTGQATEIGLLDPPVPGLLGGLEWANGVLYGLAGTPGNALWSVDPSNGATTFIGPIGVGSIFEGGLAFDGQTMWGVNHGVINGPKNLLMIDLETGAGTIAGPLGPDGDHDMNGLVFHDGELYGIDRVTNALWRIDREVPQSSNMVGSGFGGLIDLGVKGGLAGELAYADDTRNFFRVEFTTGAGEVLAGSAVTFRSLAPIVETTGVPSSGTTPRLAIEGIYPNPVKLGTQIRFAVPESGQLTLSVFDARGRLVRMLDRGKYEAGRHVIGWDGRNDLGGRVPSGIYFVRCRLNGRTLQGRVVVIR